MMAWRKVAVFTGLVVLLLLSACGLRVQSWSTTRPAKSMTVTAIPTLTKSAAPQATPSETRGSFYNDGCAWTWANQDLPDLTEELNKAFDDTGLESVDIRAAAYGENCLDTQENKAMRFAAMQTDFFLIIQVKDTADHQTAGEWIAKIIITLRPYTPGRVPGPNLGYVGIRFVSPEAEENLWFSRSEAEKLVDGGNTGSALYDMLR